MSGKTIIGKEIFSAGTWNGDVWSASDLEKIAANFTRVQKLHKAPLKLGHAETQKFMGQKDGAPALGWVSALRVAETADGIKLVADFSDVPDRVWELIKAGRYEKVSAEIYEDVKLDGKSIGPVLKAVALLGADIPAVTNLEDFHAALMTEKAPFEFKRLHEFTTDNPTYRAKPMPDEKTVSQAEFDALKERVKTFSDSISAKDDELKKHKEREEKLILEGRISKFVAARSGIMAKANELVKDGRLTPALRDELEVKIALQERKYSEEDGLSIPIEWALKLFADMAKAKLPKDGGAKDVFRKNPLEDADADADPTKGKDPGEELALAAKKLFHENKGKYKSFAEAQMAAFELNPALAEAYMKREQTADAASRTPVTQADLDSMRKGA